MQLEQILQDYWHHAMIDYSHPLLKQGTAFQQKVWQALCGIPTGQTRTYGELAQTLNTSPRALANACRNWANRGSAIISFNYSMSTGFAPIELNRAHIWVNRA
jgi:O6-methylguanine-DNA--protein-cysteine methyltransferase